MLKVLPSLKPTLSSDSLLDKKLAPSNKTKTMIPPVPSKPIVDLSSSPLHNLYQVIHYEPTSRSNSSAAIKKEEIGEKGRISVKEFMLHTYLDESGKWIKIRVYGLIRQVTSSTSLSSESSSSTATITTVVKTVVKTEEPIGVKRKRSEDNTDEIEYKQEDKIVIWKGYQRISKIPHPHSTQTIAHSIKQGLISLHSVPTSLPSSNVSSIDPGTNTNIKLILPHPAQSTNPLIVDCSLSLDSSSIGKPGSWTGEGLNEWWGLTSDILLKYNTTSDSLLQLQTERTRPLPGSGVPGSQGPVSASQVRTSSQEGKKGVKVDPTYEDYLALTREIQILRGENRQLSQENSALKGGYAGKLSLSQQNVGSQSRVAGGKGRPGMSMIQPGIRKPPKIESGFASDSDDD